MFDKKYDERLNAILSEEQPVKAKLAKLFNLFDYAYETTIHHNWAVKTLKPVLDNTLEESHLAIGDLIRDEEYLHYEAEYAIERKPTAASFAAIVLASLFCAGCIVGSLCWILYALGFTLI